MPLALRLLITLGASALFAAGCLSPEAVRRIEGTPGQEGTGIMFTKLPRAIKIMVTYPATDEQREVVETRARAAMETLASSTSAGDRILAVDTRPDERSQGSAAVMLWDTQTEEIVGNAVYDVEERPPLGEVAVWDNYSALYVGDGEDERESL